MSNRRQKVKRQTRREKKQTKIKEQKSLTDLLSFST